MFKQRFNAVLIARKFMTCVCKKCTPLSYWAVISKILLFVCLPVNTRKPTFIK